MLLEAAEELFQLVLSVAAMYFALQLVLRRQRSPWSEQFNRRRVAVMCLLALMAAAVMVAEDALNGESRPIDKAVLLLDPRARARGADTSFEAITFTASSTVLIADGGRHRIAAARPPPRRRAAGGRLGGVRGARRLRDEGIVGRERPALWEVQWYWGSSFPSGHTLVIAAFAMSVALVAGTLWPGVRVPALVLACVWTVLVGFSRLVLGVHWPTDVMVAVCLGTAIPLAIQPGARIAQARTEGVIGQAFKRAQSTVAVDLRGSFTAGRPPRNRSATIGAIGAWSSAPSGFIQVNIQLIMPNSSMVNGLAVWPSSGPGAARSPRARSRPRPRALCRACARGRAR